jgi:hypothetical protein
MKKCTYCKILKDFLEFNADLTHKDNLKSRCKTCMIVYEKQRKEKFKNIPYVQKQTPSFKLCHKCNLELPILNFNKDKGTKDGHCSVCRECCKEYQIDYKYGLTIAQKQEMFNAQNGLCYYCEEKGTMDTLAVDHDHKTDEVRCLAHKTSCNLLIGLVNEDFNKLSKITDNLKKIKQKTSFSTASLGDLRQCSKR